MSAAVTAPAGATEYPACCARCWHSPERPCRDVVRCRAEGPLLAASLQRSLVGRLGDPDRGVKPGNLAVLRETCFCPAVLVEVGFISNYPTARKMASGAWRDQTAQALAVGIVNYLRKGG